MYFVLQVKGIGKKLKMKIGQREELSTIDIAQLRDMYKCNDKEDDDETCKLPWKQASNSMEQITESHVKLILPSTSKNIFIKKHAEV